MDKSAKVTGNGTYKFKVGKNVFHLKVKAADGKVTTYTVTVNRSKKKHVVVVIIL